MSLEFEAELMSKILDELKNAEQTRRGSYIRPGVRIKGEITGNEDLITEGAIEGPVKLTDATLSIGEAGSITGNVTAKEVVVYGSVAGNVEARERVEIKSSGSIIGDIASARIVIDDGARCKGSIDIGKK